MTRRGACEPALQQAERIPSGRSIPGTLPRVVAGRAVLARVVLAGLAATLLLTACAPPIIEAPPWRAPVVVGDRLYRLSLPQGFADRCIGDSEAREARAAQLSASSTLVGCVEPLDTAGPFNGISGIITSRPGGPDAPGDFERYKTAIHQQVRATRAEAQGAPRLAGGSRVLRVLGEGRVWLVQAVYAAPSTGAPRSGVVAAGLVGDRLFYLSLLTADTGTVDFNALGEIAIDWIRGVIADNLVPGSQIRPRPS